MARVRKTRPPYERWGMAREQVVKDYPQFLKSGWIGTASGEGEAIQTTLPKFGFVHQPSSGWENIGYEVRLIELSMTGLMPEEKGHAQLARECRQLAKKIDKNAHTLCDLTHWQAVSVASWYTRTDFCEYASDFFKTARRLEIIAEYLTREKQGAKWASTRRREARLVLACKLAPLFEREFGIPAKPRGGSEARPLHEENEWTKFFQCIASLLLGETETPDRQQVLWEVAKPSEIPTPPG
jgi:hypothetical protein